MFFSKKALGLLLLLFVLAGIPICASAQTKVEIGLKIENIAADGVVFKEITAGAARSLFSNGQIGVYRASFRSGGKIFDAQLIPSPSFGRGNAKAMLLLHAPGHKELTGTLQLVLRDAGEGNSVVSESFTVTTDAAAWTFTPKTDGIFPAKVILAGSGKALSDHSWNDRVYDAPIGSFMLRNDKSAELTVLSDGPIATVLRGRAKYVHWQSSAGPAPGNPSATYDWYFFKNSPHVLVDAYQVADEPYSWSQSIFIEWIFKGDYFDARRGNEAREPVPLTSGKKSVTSQNWSALISGNDAVAIVAAPSTIHDGTGDFGKYIRSANPSPTLGWGGRPRRLTGWFWVASADSAEDLPARLDEAAERAVSRFVETDVRVVDQTMAAAIPGADSREIKAWKQAILQRKFALGNLSPDASGVLHLPDSWRFSRSGDLGLTFDVRSDGAELISVYDLKNGHELAADAMPPLFALDFLDRIKNANLSLAAHENWSEVSYWDNGDRIDLRFRRRAEGEAEILVTVSGYPVAADSAWEWKIRVENPGSAWSVSEVYFPQISLRRRGLHTRSFVPRQVGVVHARPFRENFHYSRVYPSASATMQFMAVYPDDPGKAGLYVGRHDPVAAMKRLQLESDNISLTSKLFFSQITENPETPGNGFEITGTGVWKLLRGDWFDAAKYYGEWVKSEASWWPDLGADGRVDTPLWFREMNVWSTRGGEAGGVQRMVQRFRDFLELPLTNHWYYWHQIPFDNDYPHYFPAISGFREAVHALKESDVSVVPYINGRLWDTRDKGAADFEYSSKALPWATKVRDGDELKAFTSRFRSRESDGSTVSLAVMCPYTEFWQDKVAEIVGRLVAEEGVSGVYLDQIGAAAPVPCLDPEHGHPLGGGSWWVSGYAEMLGRIQREISPEAILATEDNAEPYMKNMDGVLTWQWIIDGQVPAFPAVYGGAVQMFGRSFAAVPNEDPNPAARMKMGQQLVFGEQLGWISPDFFFGRLSKSTQDYFKRLVHARDRINSYIYAGEMLRAPKLEGNNPAIVANWKTASPVTLDSVVTGAWKKNDKNKLALIFTNVTADSLELTYPFDPAAYGIPSTGFTVTAWKGSNPSDTETVFVNGEATLLLQGLDILVWEITW